MGIHGKHGAAAAVLGTIALLVALPASADWSLYASGDFGYSIGKGDVTGNVDFGGVTGVQSLSGNDDDTSPFVGGAIGLSVPMNEATPWEMPRWLTLPDWPIRTEIEAVGLRKYQWETPRLLGNTGNFNSEMKTWSLMQNFWLDVPLRGLYRPISWTSARLFGRWRLRSVKNILDRTSLVMGAGVGLAYVDVDTSDGTFSGSDDSYNFAWQAGGGIGYAITDDIHALVGYRYIDPGDVDVSIAAQGGFNGNYDVETDIHEVRAGLRVNFWSFPAPWR